MRSLGSSEHLLLQVCRLEGRSQDLLQGYADEGKLRGSWGGLAPDMVL